MQLIWLECICTEFTCTVMQVDSPDTALRRGSETDKACGEVSMMLICGSKVDKRTPDIYFTDILRLAKR